MKVIKNSTLYLSVSIIQSFMSFLLLPLYTSLLSTGEFGLTSLINSVAGLLSIFFLFGSQSVVSRLYFEHSQDQEKLKRFLGTVFLSKLIWNLVIASVLLLGREYIFPIIGEGVAFYPYMLIAIGMAFFSSIFQLFQTLQQTKQEGWKYSVVQILYLLLNNGISVLLLVVFKLRAEGIILGTLIADIVMTIYVFSSLRKRIHFGISKEIVKDAFGFSWPIFLHALFGWAMGSINKLILNNLVSIDTVGIYTIGFTIAGIVNMVTVALNRSYTPWFFEKMKKEKRNNEDIVIFSEFIVLMYSIVALIISLFGREVIALVLSKSYFDSWRVIPFLSFGYVFNGVYFFFVNIFNYQKKSVKLVPLYTLLSALLNTGFNYLLIPRFGIIGSALSSLLAMFLLSLITYFGSKRLLNIKYNYLRLLGLISIPALFSLVVFLPINLNSWVALPLNTVYLCVVLLLIYWLTKKRYGDSYANQYRNLERVLDRKFQHYRKNR